MSLVAGARFANYEILRLLGAGGMGEVWLAKDLHLERNVALKLLPVDLTTDPARVKRFEQEARAASALNHPNVCTIHALGQTEDGRHFIAMEYVEGETLRNRLIRGLKRRETLDIAIQIASALTAAHAAGIVHRDLKPENVMLRPDGFVKVLDFGLAKLTATDSDPAMVTRTNLHTEVGTTLGTVAYMSPEQARGQKVDARTDVWALGVVLYEMSAGRRPFAGQSTSDVLAAILEHDPAPLGRFDPDVSPELQRIVGKALRKDAEQRYQVMKDLLLDLQALRDDLASSDRSRVSGVGAEPLAHESTTSASIDARDARRSARQKMLIAGIATVIVLVGGAFWWARSPTPTPEAQHGAAVPTNPSIERSLSRLTFDAGLQTDVTWSPDGRFIAYASDRSGNFDIWVQGVEGGDPVQVTKSPAQETQPDWSPDGTTIAYHSSTSGGGIYVVPALGGSERQLTSFGVHPRWSHDGSEVLIQTGFGVGFNAAPLKLYAVSPDAGSPVPLRPDFLDQGSWYWAAGHPDGRISVIGFHRQLGFGIFTVPRRDGPPVASKLPDDFALKRDTTRTTPARFQWNAAGTQLVVQMLSDGVENLWKLAVDPKTLDVTTAERLTTGPGRDSAPAFSRDGKRIAYTAVNESVRLWLYPFDAVRGRIMGEGKPVTDEGAQVFSTDLSRDGRILILAIQRLGVDRIELWQLDVDTGNRRLVTKDLGGPLGGALSADAKQLAYNLQRHARERGPRGAMVMLRSMQDGSERPLSAWSADSIFIPGGWTPDGGALLGFFIKPWGSWSVLASWPLDDPNATSPDHILIAEPKASIWQASASPNGRWLSFVVGRQSTPGQLELYVAPYGAAPSHTWTRIAADHDWPDKPRWSPDGRTLYFISRRPEAYFNLWGVRIDPNAGKPVGEPFSITNIDSPALIISPNVGLTEMLMSAKRVGLTMQSSTGNIWMLENVDR